MKIAIILGTRPEIIKMAPVVDQIEKNAVKNILIHTGQHYDHEMSEGFFIDLELKKPDYNIGVGSGSHGKQTAAMITSLEDILFDEKPDLVMVQGDTNAVLAGALTASKLNIPVGHVEAGLRSYDKTMPEEINRQMADIASTMFFVPTEEAGLNLLFENINPHDIFITGNTIVDACKRHLKIAERRSTIISELDIAGDILTLTLHRAENVDDPVRLKNIISSILELEDITVVFPVHPRTSKALKALGVYDLLQNSPNIKIIKPIGYFDFLQLLSRSKYVMTDSGGIQEEAITLNIPCMTLRYNTERPETVTAGGNILVGADKDRILKTYHDISNDPARYNAMKRAKNPYGNGDSSKRILKAVIDRFNNNKMNIAVPKEVLGNVSRELLRIDNDITVGEYEKENTRTTVVMVFKNNDPQFPATNLNLKDKMIMVNKID